MNRRLVNCAFGAVLAAAALAAPPSAWAQADYPNRTIRFVVPYSSGGLPDTVARVFARHLGLRLGQSVVVENRPGANGVVAAQALATAPADGYTFLVTDGSMFSINPAIYRNLGYDYRRDFMPVSLVARAPLYLAVHPKVPVHSLQEFIALAKSKPGMLNYGSSGIGSTHHLSMEALKKSLDIDLVHIPFKGTGQSVPALIGGQVDVLFSALPSLSGFVKADQVRLLASNALERSKQAPDLPAIAELVPGFDFAPIVGVLAMKGTPSSAIDRISTEISAIARLPEVIETLEKAGVDSIGGSPADYDKAVLAENERMEKAIVAAEIKSQ
ncbi:MAG: tripartite tricarboxylate transporter substrate binding protein [Burkholderiaceae bacterium]|nr:tripartite tricarboxylate transporter substrate binding protein [Burkholderiaceae bacterium]